MDFYNHFLGEIRIFTGNFAPANWMLCQGQLLAISDYSLLYSLLGTRYGGDGLTTFGLPDLRSRIAVGVGQGNGLSAYNLAQKGGSDTVTLQANNLPAHTHTAPKKAGLNCYSGEGNTDVPFNNYPARVTGTKLYTATYSGIYTTMPALQTDHFTTAAGEGSPIPIVQPVLGINFIICINGDFPPPPTI